MTTPRNGPRAAALVEFRPRLAIGLILIAITSGCDRMKKFIDPNGTAYGPQEAPKTVPASTGQATSAPADAGPRPPETAPKRISTVRELTESDMDAQLPSIDFSIGRRSFRLVGGLHRDAAGFTSVRDSAGRYWGRAIGDLNMDGADDAVLLLRTDMREGRVVWDLAYLPNRDGRLHNVQTIRLPGDLGFGEMVVQGSGVLLTPAQEGHNLHLGYVGGELVLAED